MMRFDHTESTWIPLLAGIALTASLAPAFAQTATDLDCVRCVDTVDVAPEAITAPKLAERSVRDVNIRAGAVTKTQIAPGAVVTGKLAGNAVTANKIADVVRTLSFPARTMSYPPSGTIITEHVRGLAWQGSPGSQAFLTLQKPADYAGGDIQITVLFQTSTGTDGDVDFFIKPRSFSTPGGLPAAVDVTSLPVSVSVAAGAIYEQTFAVPAATMQGSWWLVSFQRGGAGSTYTDEVQVRAVSVEYTATQ